MPQFKESQISLLGLIIWLLAALFFLYEFFLRTFIGTLAPQIIADLKLNAETFALIGSAYCLMYGAMQIPVGILADKFSVKRLMIFAVLICAAATLFFAHTTGFASAFLSRLFMGFGSSFAFVCLLVVAITWLPRKYFGFFAGSSQFIGTMGPLLAGGPLIIWLNKLHGNWRITLDKVGGLGIILAIFILLIVRNKKNHTNKQELVHLKSTGILSKNLKQLIKNHQVWYIALYSATIYVSLALLGAIWGTDYLEIRGLTQEHAASMISLAWLGYAIGCPLLGALSDICKRRKPILIFCALVGIIITMCIVYLPLRVHWLYGLLFFGLGVAASGQNIGFVAITERVAVGARATALGLNNAMISVFVAFVPPLVSLFIGFSAVNIQHLQPQNFIIGFSIMPIFYILALLISCFLIREKQ